MGVIRGTGVDDIREQYIPLKFSVKYSRRSFTGEDSLCHANNIGNRTLSCDDTAKRIRIWVLLFQLLE
jgi:hypothetical protein